MDMKLTPVKYNKTIVQKDGITHITDTEHDHTAYELSITEMYFEEDRRKVAEYVVRDLDRLKTRILNILKGEQEKNEEVR